MQEYTMSKLIQLRQRIKVIETIQKITHAMRLISMSVHSHLKRDESALTTYIQSLEKTFAKLQLHAENWSHPIIRPQKTVNQNTLIIIVGSQKGLCGSFNLNLFRLCDNYIKNSPTSRQENSHFIGVGQKAVDFLKDRKVQNIEQTYTKFTPQRLPEIAQKITDTILHAKQPYSSVIILSNEFKSFFNQKPRIYTLIPCVSQTTEGNSISDDILWDQSPEILLDELAHQYIEGHIHFVLFESLLAEHAARFVSMDTSTRNADSLLDIAKLQYNKLRQAKITKELTELVGSFR